MLHHTVYKTELKETLKCTETFISLQHLRDEEEAVKLRDDDSLNQLTVRL